MKKPTHDVLLEITRDGQKQECVISNGDVSFLRTAGMEIRIKDIAEIVELPEAGGVTLVSRLRQPKGMYE